MQAAERDKGNVRIMSKYKLQEEIRTRNVRIMSKYKLQNEIRTNTMTNTE